MINKIVSFLWSLWNEIYDEERERNKTLERKAEKLALLANTLAGYVHERDVFKEAGLVIKRSMLFSDGTTRVFILYNNECVLDATLRPFHRTEIHLYHYGEWEDKFVSLGQRIIDEYAAAKEKAYRGRIRPYEKK